VITISAFSRDEIVRLLGVPADRVVVTWLAPWRTGQPDGVRAADADRRSPMVLHVGTLLNRRQLPLLVRAFAPIVRRLPQARLVIVGENRTFPFEDPVALASELGIAEAVVVRAYVSDEELTRLYAEAAAFAFLSTYEGFGLTPLEAMAAGVPVVACDTAVAREVYGDAVLLVPPGDEAGVTTALTRLLEDDELRARLRAAASLTLGRLSWDTTARATLDVLEQAART
jgi:glycosyltransferase involved in cell wall biosynthesis